MLSLVIEDVRDVSYGSQDFEAKIKNAEKTFMFM